MPCCSSIKSVAVVGFLTYQLLKCLGNKPVFNSIWDRGNFM